MDYGQYNPYAQMGASLQPPSSAQRAQDPNVGWAREQVLFPEPLLPINERIGRQLRNRVIVFDTLVQNQTQTGRFTFDVPSVMYARMGGVFAGSNLPTGTTGLDQFTVRFEHSNGDRIDQTESLASTLLGSAGEPNLLGGPAWRWDNGSSCLVYVTPLSAAISQIYIVAQVVELRGPTNISAIGA